MNKYCRIKTTAIINALRVHGPYARIAAPMHLANYALTRAELAHPDDAHKVTNAWEEAVARLEEQRERISHLEEQRRGLHDLLVEFRPKADPPVGYETAWRLHYKDALRSWDILGQRVSSLIHEDKKLLQEIEQQRGD